MRWGPTDASMALPAELEMLPEGDMAGLDAVLEQQHGAAPSARYPSSAFAASRTRGPGALLHAWPSNLLWQSVRCWHELSLHLTAQGGPFHEHDGTVCMLT